MRGRTRKPLPNPKLSAGQRKTVERDCGMRNGRCIVKVRQALLYYFDKGLRFDVAERQDRPKETPIIVANWKEEYDALLRKISY